MPCVARLALAVSIAVALAGATLPAAADPSPTCAEGTAWDGIACAHPRATCGRWDGISCDAAPSSATAERRAETEFAARLRVVLRRDERRVRRRSERLRQC